ncbi:agmatinase [Kineothrix sp. MB12-C1]|uniref:agmatinase n=1 Tax=Kineothrix sp. MB12-C1 TaxID=3070215 RepID=UPI0027D2B3D3|nr:agmatinase [Kineothrix sp. MB12-C1]WMC91485.1 agmatinase [Kineothrix sp. MB12-C1]
MLNKNIVNFIGCESEYEDADIVLFGVPFDSTTSYRPGTRFGPSAIRNESYGLETYSPYQDKEITDGQIFDSGDLELPLGDTQRVLESIEERTNVILEDGKLPFMIGGEHLVTLGSVRAVHKKYPDLHIIHFDAHADLREDYLGVKLSHACVIRRCWESLGDGRIHQFGIRSGDKEEFLWAREGHVKMQKFSFDGLSETIGKLKEKPVYFTIDLDVLDPSVFPGTGTPEAGGVSFMELFQAVLDVVKGCRVVGCDVNELSPGYDTSGVSTAVAGKLVRELLIAFS